MLATDWQSPVASVLARLKDTRGLQFWDKGHLLAQRMSADARPPQPEPDCCRDNGILWDLAAVYPPGAVWDTAMPPAAFVNGPIVNVKELVEAAIQGGARGRPAEVPR
jgi:hypothetical protein